MTCPKCKSTETSVIETRHNKAGTVTRRRHHCNDCAERFTTYESIGDRESARQRDKKIQALVDAFDAIR